MSNIHGLNTDDDKPPGRREGNSSGSESDNEDNEGRQGFYVGGSERSGQQVLGPNRDEMQARLFESIQRAGAERLTPEQVEEIERKRAQTGGTSQGGAGGAQVGFRLGGHGIPSEYVPSATSPINQVQQPGAPPQRQQVLVRMFIWRNGFSIDDGPLRQFDDPQNRAFLQAVTTKRIPPELSLQYPGREVDLRIERKPDEYVPPKAKPFSGQGHRLGSHTPDIVGSSSSRSTANVEVVNLEPSPALVHPSEAAVAKAQEDLMVDDSKPVTRVQIRFPDVAQPLVVRFNHDHLVDHLRSFIVAVQPALEYSPFRILTIYPRTEIEDEQQTLKYAGLINAAVTIKFEE